MSSFPGFFFKFFFIEKPEFFFKKKRKKPLHFLVKIQQDLSEKNKPLLSFPLGQIDHLSTHLNHFVNKLCTRVRNPWSGFFSGMTNFHKSENKG
jgi:hypothetical protein